jgi:hypothetical protein
MIPLAPSLSLVGRGEGEGFCVIWKFEFEIYLGFGIWDLDIGI